MPQHLYDVAHVIVCNRHNIRIVICVIASSFIIAHIGLTVLHAYTGWVVLQINPCHYLPFYAHKPFSERLQAFHYDITAEDYGYKVAWLHHKQRHQSKDGSHGLATRGCRPSSFVVWSRLPSIPRHTGSSGTQSLHGCSNWSSAIRRLEMATRTSKADIASAAGGGSWAESQCNLHCSNGSTVLEVTTTFRRSCTLVSQSVSLLRVYYFVVI